MCLCAHNSQNFQSRPMAKADYLSTKFTPFNSPYGRHVRRSHAHAWFDFPNKFFYSFFFFCVPLCLPFHIDARKEWKSMWANETNRKRNGVGWVVEREWERNHKLIENIFVFVDTDRQLLSSVWSSYTLEPSGKLFTSNERKKNWMKVSIRTKCSAGTIWAAFFRF